MQRPDLTELSDDQLIAAGNRGLLKRAQQEIETCQTLSVVEETGGLTIEWSDGVRCEFPPGSSIRGARCSCAAASVCRHLIRSVLFLRQSNPSTSGRPEEQPTADPLKVSEADLIEQFGKAALTKARRQLAEELSIELVDPDQREVRFGTIGVVTQFPAGAALAGAICSCREPFPCPHMLPALLWLRGERPQTSKETSEQMTLAREAAVARLRRLLTELMRAGLDGVSPGWQEGAFGLRLELEKSGLSKPARLLESLSRLVVADTERAGDADPAQIRWHLAALWLRILAPQNSTTSIANERESSERATRDDLLESTVPRFWNSGAKRLQGWTCSVWWTEDLVGVTLYLRDEETGELVTVGTARPRNGQTAERLVTAVPVLGSFTVRDLLGRRLECSSTRRAEGKLRLGEGATCRLLPEAIDWRALIATEAFDTFAAVGAQFEESFPTIATLGRKDLILFRPSEFLRAEFRIDLQEFHWPVVDATGKRAAVMLRYRPERQTVIADLEKLANTESATAVLGRAFFSARGLALQPMTLFLQGDAGLRPYFVDIDRPQSATLRSSGRSRSRAF